MNIFKNKITFFFLLAIIILSFISFILSLLFSQDTSNQIAGNPTPTPVRVNMLRELQVIPTPQIVQNSQTTIPNTYTIVFNIPETTLPQEYRLTAINSYTITDSDARAIAKTFGFSVEPSRQSNQNGSQVLSWESSDSTTSLQIIPENGYVYYVNTYIPSKSDNPSVLVNPQELPTLAINFLKKHNLYHSDLITNQNLITYFAGYSDLSETTDFTNASNFKIDFERIVNRQPIFGQLDNSAQVTVWIDTFKNIKTLSYQYAPLIEDTRIVQLLTLPEAQEKLQTEGTIVQYGELEEIPNATATLTQVTITSVSIASFDDRTTGIIQPVFIFKGEARSTDNQIQPITFYLPAIKQN